MPKMEKGRPPESKRSRKPAHPVKREVSQEMKSFAESTMNELLGWYGYDKVDLQDSEGADIRSQNGRARRHQVSVLKENSDPKPGGIESKLTSASSAPAKNGVKESTGFPLSPSSSSFTPHMKDLHSTQVVVPLIKPSAVDEQQNVQIVCVWCQKEGLKRYSLVMGSELKSFCSEKCFAMCRRAYFKRNKAQNENRHSDQSSPPPPGQTEETPPQIMLKMNNNTRVCDWCKHVRHTKYLDLGAGDDRLQFCSTKCLNQYKMDIFYREARAALTTSGSSPNHPENENRPAGESETLLTPESWNNPSMEGDSKETVSPKVSTPVSSSSSSSSSIRASVFAQQKERESSASSQLRTGTPVPSTPPPHVEQPWVIQKPQSFNRAPIHAQPRNPGSSPHQRHSHTSPQVHTPLVRPIPPPQLLHPYPASMMHCAPTYPHPIPSFMPTLGLPCPQPTVLVPYPIVVPLPVPVPIPIPIPMNSGAFGHAGVIRNHTEKERTGRDAVSVTPEDVPWEQMSKDRDITSGLSAEHKVKTEQISSPDPYSLAFSSHSFPILSARPPASPTPPLPEDQRQEVRERQVIQRAACKVKQEGETEFDLTKQAEVECENRWARSGDENDHIAQEMSAKSYTGTLHHTFTHSTPESSSSPVDSSNARGSIILQKALNTTSVVTPTASIILNNTVDTSNSVHSIYSSACLPTVHMDRDQRISPSQNSSPLPECEDIKENVSGGREPGADGPPEQTDCQTAQLEESRGAAADGDALAADEHAYARSIPPKLREKNAHTITLTAAHTLSHVVAHSWDKNSHAHVPAFEQSGAHTEIEPALKRRCLRIRDQNK